MEVFPVKYLVFGVSCLVLLAAFLFASSYYKEHEAEKLGFMAREDASVFVRDHSPTLGSDDARVHLVEFMDPACETCAAFSPFVKKMLEADSGRLRLVIRYAPFHAGSDYVVKMLEGAREQGRYWETLGIMFESQRHWASHHNPQPDKLWPLLARAGIDVEKLQRDMHDPAIEKRIAQDIADARTLNVRKTPGFFVNGIPLQSFGYQQLHQLVRSEIDKQYPH
jgi:protein-disulfide isomerase